MADQRILNSEKSERVLESLVERGSVVLITGEQTREKYNFVKNFIFKLVLNRSTNLELSKEILIRRIEDQSFPDFYEFSDRQIAIGSQDKAAYGTVRHLLKHMLPYSPRETKTRFILFPDAARIRDEAESALLKSLEEPPPSTVFILMVEDEQMLKETIVSRSVQIRLVTAPVDHLISSDPWERFWYLSGISDHSLFRLMSEKKWLQVLRTEFDTLEFDAQDFPVFDKLGGSYMNKYFKQENADVQNEILALSLLPLLFSVRDALTEGMLPTIGPLRLPWKDESKLMLMASCFEAVVTQLRQKIFGSRSASLPAVYYNFLARLFPLWNSA